jgi:hypothetical protein
MTEYEYDQHKVLMDALKALYRDNVRAWADIAALRMMLKGLELSERPVSPDWEARLEACRQLPIYKNYLARGEVVLAQAEQSLSEGRLIEALLKKPSEFPN